MARGTQVTAPNPEADERSLIEAAQKDPSRFAELYEAHFERVYAYVVRRVRDRPAAEDLTSDVFHQALANLGRFEWRGVPFAAWLFRIARNTIADRGRQSAREVLVADPGEQSDERSLPDVEHHARLFRLVRGLPADQRRVIERRFVEQRSIREIATQLGRSEGAVKQLQFRGIEGLRARMGQSNA
jgi:RNA polymerase sigma-70 factor (ECF subfamily)